MDAEETRMAAAKQARSKLVTRGTLLNLSTSPTLIIIRIACPILDLACDIDSDSTHAGSFCSTATLTH